jgi:hypothetical protein
MQVVCPYPGHISDKPWYEPPGRTRRDVTAYDRNGT